MRRIIESKDKNILFKSYDYPDKFSVAAAVNDDTKTYQTKNGIETDNVLIRVNPNLKIETGMSFFEDTNNIYGKNVSGKRIVTHETEHAFDFLEGTLDATFNKEKTRIIPKRVPKDQVRYIYNKENNEYLKFIPTENTLIPERKAIKAENRFFEPRIVYFSGEYEIKKISKEEYEKVDKSKQEIFDTKGLGVIPKGEIENE